MLHQKTRQHAPKFDERPFLEASSEAKSSTAGSTSRSSAAQASASRRSSTPCSGATWPKVGKGMPVTRGVHYYSDESLGHLGSRGLRDRIARGPGRTCSEGISKMISEQPAIEQISVVWYCVQVPRRPPHAPRHRHDPRTGCRGPACHPRADKGRLEQEPDHGQAHGIEGRRGVPSTGSKTQSTSTASRSTSRIQRVILTSTRESTERARGTASVNSSPRPSRSRPKTRRMPFASHSDSTSPGSARWLARSSRRCRRGCRRSSDAQFPSRTRSFSRRSNSE